MTTVVLLAARVTGPTLPRLVAQFKAHGADEVIVLARPGSSRASDVPDVRESPHAAADLAELARLCAAGRRLVIADADLVAHDTVISTVLAGGGAVTAMTAGLVETDRGVEGDSVPVRVDRGRVISAGSPGHRVGAPNAAFARLLAVGEGHAGAAAEALGAAARSPATTSLSADDPSALALVALVRAGIPVRAKSTAPLFCATVTDPQEWARADRELAAADEDAARMRWAIKSDDDPFATYAVSSWSPVLVRLAARLRVGPTAVTWMSVALAFVAAAGFATGERATAAAAAGLLYLSFVLDCVDGQLARYTQRLGRFGGWLDTIADRSKEYAVYAGLAIGAATNGTDVWPLAIAAITLQTVRHMTDCWYGRARDEAVARLAVAPFDRPEDRSLVGAVGSGTSGVVQSLVEATNRRSLLYWVKKLMVFPIGERWLVIALGAAFTSPRIVFLALLTWGGIAALYTVGVRILRARSLRVPSMSGVDLGLHRDDGPLARLFGRAFARLRVPPLVGAGLAAGAGLLAVALAANPGGTAWDVAVPAAARTWIWGALVAALVVAAFAGRGRHDRPLDFFVPGTLRAAEFTTVIALTLTHGVPLPLGYALLAVLALFHYDLAARLEKESSPVITRAFGLGWDGRLIVLAAAGMTGFATAGFAALAGYLFAIYVVGGAVGVVTAGRAITGGAARPPRQRAEAATARAGATPQR